MCFLSLSYSFLIVFVFYEQRYDVSTYMLFYRVEMSESAVKFSIASGLKETQIIRCPYKSEQYSYNIMVRVWNPPTSLRHSYSLLAISFSQ